MDLSKLLLEDAHCILSLVKMVNAILPHHYLTTLRDYRYVTLRRKPQIRPGVIVVYLWISENGVSGILSTDGDVLVD